ncbi:MAG: formylglycine-generating enzyme family protein [Holophagae bacterium]|nr:formylglycine-generating enzyme family protein [Holophagae bacterium]
MFRMSRKTHLVLLSITIVSLFVIGCGEDEDPIIPPEVNPGTIIVDPDPPSLNAPWTLAGPDGYANGGEGDMSLTGVSPGEYTLTWGAKADYITPAHSTQTLELESTVTFHGTYLEETDPGTIVVFAISDTLSGAHPDTIDAPWTLDGPGNYTSSGVGRDTLNDMSADEYTLTAGALEDRRIPCHWTLSLDSLDTLTFQSMYVPDPGPADGTVMIPPESVSLPVTFTMGGTVEANETPHQVTLTGRVNMAATEVTNDQYIAGLQWAYDEGFCSFSNGDIIDSVDGSTEVLIALTDVDCLINWNGNTFTTSDPDRPVVEVSWYGAVAYCDWLSLQEGLCPAYDHSTWDFKDGDAYSAVAYRLPTEAEWELASRAGGETIFNTGDCLSADTEANYNGEEPYGDCDTGQYLLELTDVASYPANAWGLFDMHGNVFEWCNDWYAVYDGDETNPTGAMMSNYRVVRGGSWNVGATGCRSAYRGDSDASYSYGIGGFRPVRTAN